MTFARPRPPVATVLLCAASFLLTSCAHRLRGENFGSERSPYVAEVERAAAASSANAASSAKAGEDFVVDHRVALIGDAGYYLEDDPTLVALARETAEATKASVVFLGDNIYNEGMTDADRARGEKILGHQLAATKAQKFVIPGNHDWGLFAKQYNAKSINNQQLFVDGWPAGDAEFVPKDGCMGPEVRTLAAAADGRPAVVLVALDPTPWIHPRLRALCSQPITVDEHLARLDAVLARHRADFVIVASHYPMLTGGPHGGLSYGFATELVVTPLGWMMGGLGNTYEPAYADWIEKAQAVLRRNPPEIYAAGHDHNLQILDAGDVAGIYVVSGAGAVERVSTVTSLAQTRFAHAVPGFIVAEFGRRGAESALRLRVIESNEPAAVYELELPTNTP